MTINPSCFIDSRKGIEYSNPINYSALGLEFLYRHPGYQEDYQLYLENESPEYENRILQQDLSDLANRYDDVQLEKLLNNERGLERKYSDPSEYNLQDYQNDGRAYPQYYMQQPGDRYYPLEYRQAAERYGVVKKPRPRNPAWQTQFAPVQETSPNFSPRGNFNSRGRRKRFSVFQKPSPNSKGTGNCSFLVVRHAGHQ